MKWLKKWAALILCAVMVLTCTGCEEEEVTPENKFFTYHLTAEPDNLDPQSASGENAWTVIQSLYEGLCRLDENGAAIPGAAEWWGHNEDFTQFTFHLREGICWNNEEPLVAQDFEYAVKRALDPNTGCPGVSDLFCIRGAKAYYNGEIGWDEVGVVVEDSMTIRFELTGSFEDFPAETAKSAYMPCDEAFFLSTGGRYGKEDDMMLTNGPFALRSYLGWVYKDYIRLVRSKTYKGAREVWPTGLQFSIGASKNPIGEMKEGTLHVTKLEADQIAAAEAEELQLVHFAETTYGVLFNSQYSYFQSTAVRQALVTSIAREGLVDCYPKGSNPASGVIPEAITVNGESYRGWAGVCPDPSVAQSPSELLAAGLAELEQTKLPATLKVLCVDTQENRLIVNHLLAAWRNELGYYFNIETVSSESALQSRIQQGNYSIVITSVRPDANSVLNLTNRLTELSGYSSERYDALAAGYQARPQETARELERLLVNEGVFYPLYTENTSYALGKTVVGLVIRPFGGGLDFLRAGRT